MVGATGFEPTKQGEQGDDRVETEHGHIGVRRDDTMSCLGHPEDTVVQQADSPASAPCCTYVADQGLAAVIQNWQKLPEDIKSAILTLVQNVVATERARE